MNARLSLVFGVGMLLMLGACNSPEEKLPQITKETVKHTVTFGNRTHLAMDEFNGLEAFVAPVPKSTVTYVGLAVNDTNQAAVARARWVRSYLIHEGVDSNAIHLQPVEETEPHEVLVTLQYAKAIPPHPCPDWSKNPIANYDNTRFSNYGCAYYSNLVTQLSNPEDYDKGHGPYTSEGARDSAIIGKYMGGGVAGGGAAPATPSP